MEVMDPKRNPVQATSRPPLGACWWSGSPVLAVWPACWSPALVIGLVDPPELVIWRSGWRPALAALVREGSPAGGCWWVGSPGLVVTSASVVRLVVEW